MVRESYKDMVQEAIGKTVIRKGLNQKLSLIRDARLGSHHKTILSLIALFPEVLKVLEYVEEEGDNTSNRHQAIDIFSYFKTFDFVFYLHLMSHILCPTSLLSQALQRKGQDILEVEEGTKRQLQKFRETGFDLLLKEMYSFCEVHDVEKLDMGKVVLIQEIDDLLKSF